MAQYACRECGNFPIAPPQNPRADARCGDCKLKIIRAKKKKADAKKKRQERKNNPQERRDEEE